MDKIFISIAAYRDPLLVRTLSQAFQRADNPEALVFGLGMQYEKEIYPDLSFIPSNQLRIINYDIPTRPGVTRIRHEIANVAYSNEDYFLMIDSHMLFEKGWDTWLKQSLNNLGPKSIISGLGEIYNEQIKSVACQIIEGQRELVFGRREFSEYVGNHERGKFMPSTYIACGFMFTYGSFLTEVGLDEHSQFEAEEPYLSWRSFISGWNIYHTTHWVITHQPDEYFDAAWGGMQNRRYVRDGMEDFFMQAMTHQRGLAYVYNDYSYYAVKNAPRKPVEWFLANGYTEKDYQVVRKHYDKLIHNNSSEHDIILL